VDPSKLEHSSNSSVNALNVQCARLHEQTHINNGASCSPTQCKDKATVPAAQQNQSECQAYQAQLACMDSQMTATCPASSGAGGCSYGLGGLPGFGFPDECSCKQDMIVIMNNYAKLANQNYGCGFNELPACYFAGTCP
jgi:hypothetical protein